MPLIFFFLGFYLISGTFFRYQLQKGKRKKFLFRVSFMSGTYDLILEFIFWRWNNLSECWRYIFVKRIVPQNVCSESRFVWWILHSIYSRLKEMLSEQAKHGTRSLLQVLSMPPWSAPSFGGGPVAASLCLMPFPISFSVYELQAAVVGWRATALPSIVSFLSGLCLMVLCYPYIFSILFFSAIILSLLYIGMPGILPSAHIMVYEISTL